MKAKFEKSNNNEEKISCYNVNKISDPMFVTFWGVRGTLPTPGNTTLKYGGNTSCVEVVSFHESKRISLIFDAGSGITKCAENALAQGEREFCLFFSHLHYDHIIGLIKFIPLFRKDCQIHIYAYTKQKGALKNIFERFFCDPFFPVEYEDLPAKNNIIYHEIVIGQDIFIKNYTVRTLFLNHPQTSIAYRVYDALSLLSVVYATDHEHGTLKDDKLIQFISNTDVFIYDSTFSDSSYKNFIGWGHSTARFGAELSAQSKVRCFFIFHHDPNSSDEYLENKILQEAQDIFPASFLARELETISINELHDTLT